jgi:predicted DNA-binding transcriptional regulator AlpA
VSVDRFLNIAEAQQVLPLSSAWFAKQRAAKTGPPFVRIGTRVLYPHSELVAWAKERAVKAAADASALPRAA